MNNQYRNYPENFIEESDHYFKHVSAMTGEKLNSKSDIAAELAFRDERIAELEKERDALDNFVERYMENLQEVLEKERDALDNFVERYMENLQEVLEFLAVAGVRNHEFLFDTLNVLANDIEKHDARLRGE